MSADGRFVAFQSLAQDLVAGTSGAADIFVHDRDADSDGIFDETGAGERATVLISLSGDGTPSNQGGIQPSISADGRFVAFASLGNNLVSGDNNMTLDVFVHDRDADTDGIFDETGIGERATFRVSVLPDGTEGNHESGSVFASPVSATGRFVTFVSKANNLVAGDIDMFNAILKIFVHDRDADNDGLFDETGVGERATVLVSVSSSGAQATNSSTDRSMSADGRFVAFQSLAQDLVAGTSGAADIFVHDRDADNDGIFDETGAGERATVLISLASDGTPSNQGGIQPSISADGRFVAFASLGNNLVSGDNNMGLDIFVHDRDADADGIFDETGIGERATFRVSVLPDGTEANASCVMPSISADGRFVAFQSPATNLTIPADMFGFDDIFLAATGIP